MKKSQELIEAELAFEKAIIKQEKRYRIKPIDGQSLDERCEITTKAFEHAIKNGDEYIDQPLHPSHGVHKEKHLLIATIGIILMVIYALFDKDGLDKSGSGFGLIMMFGICMGLFWISILFDWIKVWTRSERQ